ncbi:PREDICTED: uncharacterized protein LOC108447346 [Corvus brachyrhynchos]|uniref:uncharacterized protein LOC108447346 n=1 Tax=Corvus brachyrhynchos TaxID=85066 RepID=UPI0008163525|nr:PREDICTED: uncharacterized protein LOC108447346 [Corvus brachyrhynchos]
MVCVLESKVLRELLQKRSARTCFVRGGCKAFASTCSEPCARPATPTRLSLPLSVSSAPQPSRLRAPEAPAEAVSKAAVTSPQSPGGPPRCHNPGKFLPRIEKLGAEKAAFGDSLEGLRQPDDTRNRGDLVPSKQRGKKRQQLWQVLEMPDPAALSLPSGAAAERQRSPAPQKALRQRVARSMLSPDKRLTTVRFCLLPDARPSFPCGSLDGAQLSHLSPLSPLPAHAWLPSPTKGGGHPTASPEEPRCETQTVPREMRKHGKGSGRPEQLAGAARASRTAAKEIE